MKNSANQEAVEEFEKVLRHTSDHERVWSHSTLVSHPHMKIIYISFLQAYFECGIVKLRAGNSKGVLDLNRALAINPQFFQVLQICIVSVFCSSTLISCLFFYLLKSPSHSSLALQAYLARAAHFGKSGRYAKAILNCNEAIKLVPKSVRAYLCRLVPPPV